MDEPEVSYLGKVDGSINVSLPADFKYVFGASTDIGQTDNGDSWTVDGGKLEMQTGGSLPKSEQGSATAEDFKYLDLKAMERSMTALSAKWAKTAPANASHDFSDMNRRHIAADGDEAHLDIDPAELRRQRLGRRPSRYVNVDAEKDGGVALPSWMWTASTMPNTPTRQGSGVIYNLTDSKSEDGSPMAASARRAPPPPSSSRPRPMWTRPGTSRGQHHQERGHRRRIPPQQRERTITRHVEVKLDGQTRPRPRRSSRRSPPGNITVSSSGPPIRTAPASRQAGRHRVRRGEGHRPVPAVGGEACAPL